VFVWFLFVVGGSAAVNGQITALHGVIACQVSLWL